MCSPSSLIIFLLFFFFFFCYYPFASSITLHAITPTSSLRDGDILISNGSTTRFELGFFTPGNSSSDGGKRNRYLGIWYSKVTIENIVWVANRDKPITASDGILSITENGNLIVSSGNITVWSTNISFPSTTTTTTAKLLESGNLVLLKTGRGNRNPIWESFNYPTHVFLPGMKLGNDRKSGFNWTITSWKSADDPGTGIYSFRMDTNGSPELVLYRDGDTRVYRSGPWVGTRWSGMPSMKRSIIFDYTFIDDGDAVYLTYRSLNASVLYHVMVDGPSGTVRRRTWDDSNGPWNEMWIAPEDVCDRYGECGAYGLCNANSDEYDCSCFPGYYPKYPEKWYNGVWSGGCRRNNSKISVCHNGEGFLKLPHVKVPDTSSGVVQPSMGIDDCGKECLKNCSCMGYTRGGGENGSGCIWFYGDLMDTRQYSGDGGQDVYYRIDALHLAKVRKPAEDGDKNLLLVLILPLCGALLSIVLIFSSYWYLRKKRREWRDKKERSLWLNDIEDQDENKADAPVFHFDEIAVATKNFSNQLGRGGFGAVYKGTLSNGQEIAVKRLAKNSRQGMQEFKNEVRLIAKLQHKNLVKTLGFCIRGEEKMLVYEYMPHRGVDSYIFGEKEKRLLLNWRKRYDIILGVARGMLYLHQDSRLKIIHRDLKASNVLLDSSMEPKISDFGTARIFGNEQIEACTNRVIGTHGYMAPEYAVHGLISEKMDVFSFGVMALEIMSGKKCRTCFEDDEKNYFSTSLISLVWRLWKEENVKKVVDPLLVEESSCNQERDEMILRCIQIGLLCVQDDVSERPNMSEVVFMLSNNCTELPSPNEPSSFMVKGDRYRPSQSGGDPSSTSSTSKAQQSVISEATCTTLEAR